MKKITVRGDDIPRTFGHIPSSAPRAEASLLVALHGRTQNSRVMRSFSGGTLDALAERIGADLVYLDGYRRAWNDGRRTTVSAAQRKRIDDVSFVRAVIERYGRPALAIGYSNGGQLVHRVLREAPGLLVGAVTIAAGLPVDDDYELAGVEPDAVPVLLFHGTADPVVPYAGGPTRLLGRSLGSVLSAHDTAERYSGGSVPVATADGPIERLTWPNVRLVTQRGAGHVIPNRVTKPPFIGPSLSVLDAGEEIEDFFGLGTALPATTEVRTPEVP